MMADAAVCVIGFGELGSMLVAGLAGAGIRDLRVVIRPRGGEDLRAARIRASGAEPHTDLGRALGGARVVVSAVPAGASAEVAARAAERLDPGALLVDVSAAHPDAKAASAELVGRHGGRYADVAVLGTVLMSGYAVPMLASGPGAGAWTTIARSLGMQVQELGGPAGRAAAVKLLRSVYLKGRDALVAETLLAARRYGLEDELLPTIAGPGEQVTFPELAERVLCSLAVHADRRADELEGSADLVRAAGVEPLVTAAAAERLRWIAGLGLREEFAGERPRELGVVLDAIERRATPTTRRTAAAWERPISR